MAVSAIKRVLSSSPTWHSVNNGDLQDSRYYMVLLEDASVNNGYFVVPYNSYDNQGGTVFSIVLNNGYNMYLCTGNFVFSNGTLSITDAKRAESSTSSQQQTWNVSVRMIWEIG